MLKADASSRSNRSLLQVYTDNRDLLVRFAIRLTGCRAYAEDVVQDAFFKLTSAARITASPKAQLSYLFQIVRNLSVDHYRKQTLIKKYFSFNDEIDTAVDHTTPEETYSDIQTLKQIDDALTELPERTRYAFERHRIQGVSQKEIARELGVSTTLVNFMMRDALVHCSKSISAACSPA